MKELAHIVSKKKEEFTSLKLMLVHRNHDKMLADALGATMEINIIFYRHSLPYKYRGTHRVQSILSSARYLMSLLPEEIPLKSLSTTEDLTTFLKSTDKALLVLEFCGWTPKLMAKVMNNRSENAFGITSYPFTSFLKENKLYDRKVLWWRLSPGVLFCSSLIVLWSKTMIFVADLLISVCYLNV